MEEDESSEEVAEQEQERYSNSNGAVNHTIASAFGLPDEVAALLPSDPFEQLDVARKITSIALASRVSSLEAENAQLRRTAAEKDEAIDELRSQLGALDASLADLNASLSRALQEKDSLLNENASLSNTVRKLNRDVTKLETFRKTLMQSLQEDEEGSQTRAQKMVKQQITDSAIFSNSSGSLTGVEEGSGSSSKSNAAVTQLSEGGSSVSLDTSTHSSYKDFTSSAPSLLSYNSTPNLSPRHSSPRFSATRSRAESPTRSSNPVSPRRHSISFSTRGMIGDRSSYSSMPSSLHSSMTTPLEAENQTGRTLVDGKEFFRQVRSRLSYEQFNVFLTNVKDLNAHKQSKEETLRSASEIFGPDNKDLFAIFDGLINRNLH